MFTHDITPVLSEKGRRLALVVGVNAAPRSGLSPLQNAHDDAVAIADALRKYGKFELHKPPLLNEDAKSGDVRNAILDLIKDRTNGVDRSDDDFLLFYFSGHGYQTIIEAEMRAAYLVTSDFDAGHVVDDNASHLSMHWLRDMLFAKTKAGRVLLILDCCYAEDVRTPNDHYLEELRQRIAYYFEVPGREIETMHGGVRVALAASRYDQLAYERDGHGEMTRLLLQALNGTKEDLLDDNGQLTLYRLCEYIGKEMPTGQNPVVQMIVSENRACVLAFHSERIDELRKKRTGTVIKERPDNYIPIDRNSTFQERPYEFDKLEKLLFPVKSGTPPHIDPVRVGIIGMGGQGKTRLALEVADRYKLRFPGGVYWMAAPGKNKDEWIEHFADLVFNTGYFPVDDNRVSEKENKRNRARHICRYLTSHDDALLILDNVEEPNLINSSITEWGGQEARCTIIYTSRNSFAPSTPGVVLHSVEKLPEPGAMTLLLEKRQITQRLDSEMDAAHSICQYVNYLPLALILLRSLLQDPYETVVKLERKLKERGAIETTRIEDGTKPPLFSTFELSWDKLQSEDARRVLKLASCFPEAMAIPLWLLGLGTGMGENSYELDIAYRQLRQWSLIEYLSDTEVRLHPIIREFGQVFVAHDSQTSESLLADAGKRLLTEFKNLSKLENRAYRLGYWQCLDMVHVASALAKSLHIGQEIEYVERWMIREGSLLGDTQTWPTTIPGLFYQQLYNRSLENGHLLTEAEAPNRWLRQESRVGAEDPFLLQNLTGHEGDINCIAFSYDGQRVVTGLSDWTGTVRMWDALDGRLLEAIGGHDGAVIGTMFLPGNSNVVIGTTTGMVNKWDIQHQSETMLLPAESRKVEHMAFAFSSNGINMVADTSGKIVRVRSVAKRKILATFTSHGRDVTSVAFSPNGSRVVTGCSDKFARVWDIRSGQIVTQFEEHDQGVTSVAFSPDGRYVVTGAEDSTARVWDVISKQCIAVLKGHEKPITSVTFSPDSKKVAAGSTDGTVLLWNIGNQKIVKRLHGHTDRLVSMAFSPDGLKLATGARDRTARIWNVSSEGVPVIEIELCCELTSVAFSSNGSRVVTASNSETFHIWDVEKEQVLSSLYDIRDLTKHVTFSPDGNRVATGSARGNVYIWDWDKRSIQKILSGHTGDITSLRFSPDGTMLATASTDATARIWNMASGGSLILEGHLSEVTSVAFSPNGDEVITGSKDGTAGIWKVAGQSKPLLLKDRFRDVTSVCFSHDGTMVGIGSSDGTVRLWQQGNSMPFMTVKRSSSEITILHFSPDDRLVLVGDKDGWVSFWHVDTQESKQPIGIYSATYGVGAIYWQNTHRLVLADMGGPQHRPHLYHLTLEGTW